MNSLVPAPDVLGIPGPTWLFQLLLHVTFLLHLVLMNFLVGGAVIAAVERLRARRQGETAAAARADSAQLARWLETKLPTLFALTVTFGVAPLLFLQTLYGQFFYSSSVVMAWPWLSIILVLLVTYSLAYALAWRGERFGAAQGVASFGIVAGFLLIAFLISNNMGLGWRADAWGAKYFGSATGLHLNLDDPTFWPRLLHFLLATVAVTGMILATVGARRLDRGQAEGQRWLQLGALWYIVPTVIQIAIGMWWMMALPRPLMMSLLGEDRVVSTIFVTSITLPFVSLGTMVVGLLSKRSFPWVHASSWLLVLTLIGMILTRDAVRRSTMAPHFQLDQLHSVPQWGLVGLFVGLFLVSLVVVGWMVSALWRSGAAGGSLSQ